MAKYPFRRRERRKSKESASDENNSPHDGDTDADDVRAMARAYRRFRAWCEVNSLILEWVIKIGGAISASLPILYVLWKMIQQVME